MPQTNNIIHNYPTKLLSWAEVEPVFSFYLPIWSNHIPLNWAIWSWQCLHKGGLTIFNNDKDELSVRRNAVALSLIYYEYCHRTAFHESSNFIYWDDERIKTLKRDFLVVTDEAESTICCLMNCLTNQSDNVEINTELWINCLEARQGFVFGISEKFKLYKSLIHSHNYDFNFDKGFNYILGGSITDISTYESISGL